MDSNMKNAPKYPAKDPAEKQTGEAANMKAGSENSDNPHNVTKDQIGGSTEPIEAIVTDKNDEGIEDIVVTDAAEPVESVVEFSKKYRFEGKVIENIDLSALEDLNQKSAKTIEKTYKKLAKGNVSVQPELTDEYAIATASFITGLPVEFFEQLRHKDIIKIRNRVINFTFGD